jgi:hypothetical protein
MKLFVCLCLLPLWCCTYATAADSAQAAVENAHTEMWRRFMDEHGIMLDFTDLDGKVVLPTPEECREGKPNALGWWSPIENGAMFNGLYMDAALLRWMSSKSAEDAEKARKVMRGLLKLNQISDVPGFVGRGVSTDGISHFPMGSNDQMLPWMLGLWRYYDSALATEDERAIIQQHLVRTITAVKAKNWAMPAEQPFGIRGTFQGYHFEEVARMLFALKLMHQLTGQQSWADLYSAELGKREKEGSRTKLETCAAGMAYFYAKTHAWTSCTAVGALRALWRWSQSLHGRPALPRG